MKFFCAVALSLAFLQCLNAYSIGSSFTKITETGLLAYQEFLVEFDEHVWEIKNYLLPELQSIKATFDEVSARVTSEMKDETDQGRKQLVKNIISSYEKLIKNAGEGVTRIASGKKQLVPKIFKGKDLLTDGYRKINDVVGKIENSCKTSQQLADYAVQQATAVTECVLTGADNIPTIPNAAIQIRNEVKKSTRKALLTFQRCPAETGTTCFGEVLKHINSESNIVVKIAEGYFSDEEPTAALQYSITSSCVKRNIGQNFQDIVAEFKSKC